MTSAVPSDPSQSDPAPAEVSAARDWATVLYDELRSIARREMGKERSDHTLQPTALVNEAFVRLVGGKEVSFADRESFFAAAANVIRRVLVDHARSRGREKRGGGRMRVPLEGLELADAFEPCEAEDLVRLDEALARLAAMDGVKARIVELRFFAGLSMEALVTAMNLSESTIRREWRMARAWLLAEMERARGQ